MHSICVLQPFGWYYGLMDILCSATCPSNVYNLKNNNFFQLEERAAKYMTFYYTTQTSNNKGKQGTCLEVRFSKST